MSELSCLCAFVQIYLGLASPTPVPHLNKSYSSFQYQLRLRGLYEASPPEGNPHSVLGIILHIPTSSVHFRIRAPRFGICLPLKPKLTKAKNPNKNEHSCLQNGGREPGDTAQGLWDILGLEV